MHPERQKNIKREKERERKNKIVFIPLKGRMEKT